jgi:hypothetical protein
MSVASAACGLAQLEGRRPQACRCSRGRRPSESDSEARDRLVVPPQRHPSGVGDPLTRTPLRRACRPQRPSSPLIAHARRTPNPTGRKVPPPAALPLYVVLAARHKPPTCGRLPEAGSRCASRSITSSTPARDQRQPQLRGNSDDVRASGEHLPVDEDSLREAGRPSAGRNRRGL